MIKFYNNNVKILEKLPAFSPNKTENVLFYPELPGPFIVTTFEIYDESGQLVLTVSENL